MPIFHETSQKITSLIKNKIKLLKLKCSQTQMLFMSNKGYKKSPFLIKIENAYNKGYKKTQV